MVPSQLVRKCKLFGLALSLGQQSRKTRDKCERTFRIECWSTWRWTAGNAVWMSIPSSWLLAIGQKSKG